MKYKPGELAAILTLSITWSSTTQGFDYWQRWRNYFMDNYGFDLDNENHIPNIENKRDMLKNLKDIADTAYDCMSRDLADRFIIDLSEAFKE